MKKSKEQKQLKKDADMQVRNDGRKMMGMKWLIAAWLLVLTIIIAMIVAGFFVPELLDARWMTLVVTFASFIATSFFSVSIYNHNTTVRDSNIMVRQQSEAVNRRAEVFRNLQFVASNYSIIDFVDFMLIYEESSRYKNKLKNTSQFNFYMLEQGVSAEDVAEHFEDYVFLTLRIPFEIIEGKSIGKLSFKRLKFDREDKIYRFVPPTGMEATSALILHNEDDDRKEAIINLITKKESDFYNSGDVNPFLKIKFRVIMQSLLGVATGGSIELYFTNPEKIEKSGANKYKINSSQFELIGMPVLKIGKEYDLD